MIADGDIESANATHRVDQRCVIDQVPHLRITEELGEKAGVDRECCRSSLCERCVTVVEELRHVAEQQALGEGTRGARLHVDDRDSSCLEVLEDRGQAGEVEHITQALPNGFGHNGEARVATGHSQQMGGTLALLPQGTPLTWIASGEQEGSRRTLAKTAGEERRTADLAGDHSLDVRRVEGDEIGDGPGCRVIEGVGQAQHDPVIGIHHLRIDVVVVTQSRGEGQGPGSMDLRAERRVDDDPPVAEFVPKAFDHDGAVIGKSSRRLALLGQIGDEVAARIVIEADAAQVVHLGFGVHAAQEFPDSEA